MQGSGNYIVNKHLMPFYQVQKLPPPPRMFRYANVLTVFLLLAISFWGCKKQDDVITQTNETHIAAKFAKKHLTDAEFRKFDWKNIQNIPQGDSILGWMAKPVTSDNAALSSLTILARKGQPYEIIQHTIKNPEILKTNNGFLHYGKKEFISGKNSEINIRIGEKDNPNSDGFRAPGKLISECNTCNCGGTLPCVVIVAKKRIRTIYVDLGADLGNLEHKIYVPMWEEEQSGGAGGGSGENGGPGSGDGSNGLPPENMQLSQNDDNYYYLFKNVYLFTPNYYPGMNLGWPWKWWDLPYAKDENGFLHERKFELLFEFEKDDFFLKNCKEIEAIIKFGPMFQQIAQYSAPQTVIDRLTTLKNQSPNLIIDNFNLQQLEEATGPVVNCDFFPVKIDKLPNGMNAAQFLEYFRLNINSFITLTDIFGGPAAKFDPYKVGQFDDTQQWLKQGTQSIGAVVHIDMANDGSVILSDYQNQMNVDGSQSHSFVFSTLETPLDLEHPVAGNRKFGIYSNPSSPNSFTFYTMGVDRTWDGWFKLLNIRNFGFIQADKLWNNIQDNLVSFINTQGGVASSYSPKEHISRPNYTDVEEYLKGNISIIVLKNRLGC